MYPQAKNLVHLTLNHARKKWRVIVMGDSLLHQEEAPNCQAKGMSGEVCCPVAVRIRGVVEGSLCEFWWCYTWMLLRAVLVCGSLCTWPSCLCVCVSMGYTLRLDAGWKCKQGQQQPPAWEGDGKTPRVAGCTQLSFGTQERGIQKSGAPGSSGNILDKRSGEKNQRSPSV